MVSRNEETMYTGTLIENLMKTVERSEQRALQARSQEEKLAYFYSLAESEVAQADSRILGAA